MCTPIFISSNCWYSLELIKWSMCFSSNDTSSPIKMGWKVRSWIQNLPKMIKWSHFDISLSLEHLKWVYFSICLIKYIISSECQVMNLAHICDEGHIFYSVMTFIHPTATGNNVGKFEIYVFTWCFPTGRTCCFHFYISVFWRTFWVLLMHI